MHSKDALIIFPGKTIILQNGNDVLNTNLYFTFILLSTTWFVWIMIQVKVLGCNVTFKTMYIVMVIIWQTTLELTKIYSLVRSLHMLIFMSCFRSVPFNSFPHETSIRDLYVQVMGFSDRLKCKFGLTITHS